MAFIDYLWLIDPMVMFGQIAIGIALLFGVLFRLAAFFGTMFWMGGWQDGLMAGFPVENGFFVTSQLVYALLLFGLGAWGAGRILGIDAWLEDTELVASIPALRFILG